MYQGLKMNPPIPHEIDRLVRDNEISPFIARTMRKFYQTYSHAVVQNGYRLEEVEPHFRELLTFTVEQIRNPYQFEAYHQRITEPFNYYRFGNDFIRPLIDLKRSKVYGLPILDLVDAQLQRGENVIFLANHQIEPDPQVISTLLEPTHPKLAEEMIFIAGHRVITDPIAIPFSLGRNLICIYSKKHMEHPLEQKAEKLTHNRRALKKMGQLLTDGGKCIYVAPSGGRDRPDAKGQLKPAPFDPQSIEMILLITKQTKRVTHFYPLTLATYQLLPPPSTVEQELGEYRLANSAPAYLHFDTEVDLESLGSDLLDKKLIRKKRADILWKQVLHHYAELKKNHLC
jgi:glycerol-3-phosphate O-acyltransferase